VPPNALRYQRENVLRLENPSMPATVLSARPGWDSLDLDQVAPPLFHQFR